MSESYDFKTLEAKWQGEWQKTQAWRVTEQDQGKKMYVLDMFPYPSGDGLHVGHAKVYTASDIVARYLRMRGYAVLHPTGWDAFGLPTENSALKLKVHPAKLTARNIDRFRGQMQRLGLSYDWDREINTTNPFYYKWTQWIFLQLYRMGLVYEATVPINWCPSCKTGLANEEVAEGVCERCGTRVELKPMRQWMMKITRYAEQLLDGLSGLDWPASILDMQRNWIGRSEGAIISFPLESSQGKIEVFTTRPDTLYGATYLVVAPEHPLLDNLTTSEQREAVAAYREGVQRRRQREREDAGREKTGVLTGGFVRHPLTQARVPVWVADYVLMSYGTGAVMAVPAHDERDYAFAKHYSLPIVEVIEPPTTHRSDPLPYVDEGVLVNSDNFSGQTSEQARGAIVQQLQLKGGGRQAVIYKLRDWVFSRQRYWGEPIPIIHCERCGAVPVPEADLPVILPVVERYEPTGTGESPLAAIQEWVRVKCPSCPNIGRRETNTMPQWAGSSWYFLRFADPRNNDALASREAMDRWLPVDVYVGGAEHAVLHLLYARFWTQALHDAGVLALREPFVHLRSVGLVRGEDGQKMSKSRGNVINPDNIIAAYGADTLRLYVMFMGPFEASAAWNTSSIVGVHRFLQRVRNLARAKKLAGEVEGEMRLTLHRAIKRVTEGTEQFKFNTAIAALMEFLNYLEEQVVVPKRVLESYILLLSIYAPHLAEELWSELGYESRVSVTPWPAYDEDVLAAAPKVVAVQVNGRVRGTVSVESGAQQDFVEQSARALPNVARYLAGAHAARVVFVIDSLINFVIEPAKEKK